MKEYLNTFGLLIIMFLLVVAIFKPDTAKDEGDYSYCVQWGAIDRSDIPVLCYDFKNSAPKCDWEFMPDGSLQVSDRTNPPEAPYYLNCTLFVKALPAIIR